MDAKGLRGLAEDLFTKKQTLNTLHQEIANNFYPERADFTYIRQLGTDFAANLTTSYPILCRRDLGDQMESMLRPTGKQWFHMKPVDASINDNESKRWMQWAEKLMRNAMYDRATQFTRATKEGDHDFAAFGSPVISIELDRDVNTLLYRCWHLRDCAWKENAKGQIGFVGRRWKPTASDLMVLFKDKNHEKVRQVALKTPFEDVNVMHMVCEREMYDGMAKGFDGDAARIPRWSVWYDCDNQHLIEAIPIHGRYYVIPRWQTVSGSQYAFSPATVAALPEGRLIQAMAYTILEAGEKIANPPMVATIDAVRSDVSIYAGGLSWVDREYDERLGPALRALTQDARGMPITLEMQQASRAILKECFYLNKLSLPRNEGEMTAYEVGQRIQEYIRNALPLFAPMETEYNGGLCEETFDILKRAGAFGSPFDMPRALRDAEVDWHFESPLHEAIDRQKVAAWQEGKQIIADAVALDRTAIAMIDAPVALRDVLEVVVPAHWVRSEVAVEDIKEAQQAAEDAQTALAAIQQGAEAAANLGSARKDVAQAGAVALPV